MPLGQILADTLSQWKQNAQTGMQNAWDRTYPARVQVGALMSGDPQTAAKVLKDQIAALTPEDVNNAIINFGVGMVGNIKGVGEGLMPNIDYQGEHTPPMKDSGAPLHDLTGGGKVYPDDIYSPQATQYYGHYGNNDPMDRQTINFIQSLRNRPNDKVTMYRAIPDVNTEVNSQLKDLYHLNWYKGKYGFYPVGNETIQGLTDKYNANGEGVGAGYNDMMNNVHNDLQGKISDLESQLKTNPSINAGDWVTINKNYAKEHGESALNGNYKIISKKVPASTLFTNGDSIHEFGYDPSGVSK